MIRSWDASAANAHDGARLPVLVSWTNTVCRRGFLTSIRQRSRRPAPTRRQGEREALHRAFGGQACLRLLEGPHGKLPFVQWKKPLLLTVKKALLNECSASSTDEQLAKRAQHLPEVLCTPLQQLRLDEVGAGSVNMEYDLVIRNGTIIDGTGRPAYRGDVAILDGWIVGVGRVVRGGRREIDAAGLLVTPGFTDIHTHYDGQLIWSSSLIPSSGHGVTTVITGNCGIGFAPCKPSDRESLIKLMEGVEDIPEAVASAGLTWDWETFPEFLNAIERRPHDIDVGCFLPHSPLRVYAMGQRGIQREQANTEELKRLKALTGEAIEAGALGVGTSRLAVHRSSSGDLIPSYGAMEQELHAIADAMKERGSGVFQMVSMVNRASLEVEFALMTEIARRSQRPVTYTQAQTADDPEMWRDVLDMLTKANEQGLGVKAQLFPRPIGLIIGLTASIHPFSLVPSWRDIAGLPLSDKVMRMRNPDVRRRLLNETQEQPNNPLFGMARAPDMTFRLARVNPNYEPPPQDSVAFLASVAGVSAEEYLYDCLLEDDGKSLLLVALGNYAQYNLDFVRSMLSDANVVVGLGDGGAHYGMICDASFPTFMLTHWARDRASERISIEQAVRILARKPAEVVGLNDRGVIGSGYRAHLNVIDLDRLTLYGPEIIHDLPGGGRRLHQSATGYVATVVNGVVIRQDDRSTGNLPGRLIRGAQTPKSVFP